MNHFKLLKTWRLSFSCFAEFVDVLFKLMNYTISIWNKVNLVILGVSKCYALRPRKWKKEKQKYLHFPVPKYFLLHYSCKPNSYRKTIYFLEKYFLVKLYWQPNTKSVNIWCESKHSPCPLNNSITYIIVLIKHNLTPSWMTQESRILI